MNATILNLVQGSREWHEFRATSDGASEAPVMMGKSKYQSRSDLLKLKSTGIAPDVDSNTQTLFDRGHATEIGGRAMAEKIIGEEFSPVVMSKSIDGLNLSASLDGINFDGNIIFEHKLYSAALGEAINANEIAEHYTIQMDQQLLVSGAEKCLFMASDGTEENCRWLWYETSKKKCDSLVVGWLQFHKDLAAYQPAEYIPAPKANAIMALPTLSVTVRGEVTASNLREFKEAASAFVAAIKTELVTDADFANAEATVKFCKVAEENIDAAKKNALAQTASIDDLMRTCDFIKSELSSKRLMLDRLVKSEKENRKAQIVNNACAAFAKHVIALDAEIVPIRLVFDKPDFAGAIKGKKTLSSMQDAVDAMVANSKIAADAAAKDIRAKLIWFDACADEWKFLFKDLSNFIFKPAEDYRLIVTSRIKEHKDAEAAKEEATRQRIQQEEEAKAKAKAEAEAQAVIAAERAKMEAEAKAQRQLDELEQETLAQQERKASASAIAKNVVAQGMKSEFVDIKPMALFPGTKSITTAIMEKFNVSHGVACNFVIEAARQMRDAA